MKNMEGGSNAIKGFLFQFDRTILEILRHPEHTVTFEQEEDIQREKYYIQVKERGKSKYYPSAIRNAVEQLFDLFLENETRKFCLYCHFQDREKLKWAPRTNDLNEIFGKSNKRYGHEKLALFCESFIVEFSHDYETEFQEVLQKLKSAFGLSSTEVAVMYHAVVRSYLLDLSVKQAGERKASFSDIDGVMKKVRRRVSMDGYQELLGKERYEKALHRMYFKHKRPNIDNFERLFVVECEERCNPIELMQLIMQIANMYYIKGKSPQPFILFRNADPQQIRDIKRGLLDKNFMFNDGTWFDGDRVRGEKLFAKSIEDAYGKVKFLPSEKLLTSDKLRGYFDEIYDFYCREPLSINEFSGRYIETLVCSISQTLKVLKN
ncbi:MAG: hypothetical protein NT055_02110 [Nitrospirae bacterium]|nr:hypothetical protein [Nitrospirota bacterium]